MANDKLNLNNKPEELNDKDLNKVTGGGNLTLHFFDTPEQVRFIFFTGDIVYVKKSIFNSTVKCRVIYSEVFYDSQYNCYEDMYIVRGVEDSSYYVRALRDDIVNQAD